MGGNSFCISVVSAALALALAGCAGPTRGSASVERVDQLLTLIERVQAETAVAKEAAHVAVDQLCALVSPAFGGDAAQAYAGLRAACDRCEEQADALRDSVRPMNAEADDVFERWTRDLESFGNTRLRQRSQARLDETRVRYQALANAAQAAQIALDGFHSDLEDHALYLGNDLNSGAVASLRADVRALVEALQGVDARLDATVTAARAYVEACALYGQLDAALEQPEPRSEPAPAPAPTNGAKRRPVTTLKPKSTTRPPSGVAPTPEASAGPDSAPPAPPEPVPEPEPEPRPEPQPAPGDDDVTPGSR